MKYFIVQDDNKTSGKVLKEIELANRKDDKMKFEILMKLKCSMNGYYNLTANEIGKLSETAQDFFHLIYCFRKNEKITNFVNIWLLEDPLQKENTVTCGLFQTYFYENLFFPDNDSKIQDYKKLNNEVLETLLNELYSLDQEQNEKTINKYIKQQQINLT